MEARVTQARAADDPRAGRGPLPEAATTAPARRAVLAGLGLLAAPLTGCGRTEHDEGGLDVEMGTPNASRADVDTLIVGVPQDLPPLDQAMNWRTNSAVLLSMCYENLVKFHYDPATDGYRFEPEIASSWEVSDDGRRWTFRIADGRRFDDGAYVTAQDVKFSLDRILAINRGPAAGLSFIREVAAPSARELVLFLHQPSSTLLPLLANSICIVINRRVAQFARDGDFGSAWLNTRTAGSGPYRLVSTTSLSRLVLERNPNYAGTPGRLRQVVLETVNDDSIRALRLSKGDLDIAMGLSHESTEVLADAPGVVLHTGLANAFTNLALNTRSGIMADVRTRRAVELGIDWPSLALAVRGQGALSQGALSPNMLGAEPQRYRNRYDIEAARALLAEAGVRPGARARFVYANASPLHEIVAIIVQASLSAIGLNVRLERMTGIAAVEAVTRGRFDMSMFDWNPAYNEPALMLNYWFDPDKVGTMGNKAFYANARVGELVRLADREQNVERRAAQIREAVSLAAADCPYVYLIRRANSVAVSSRLRGYEFDPNFSVIFSPERYWLEPAAGAGQE